MNETATPVDSVEVENTSADNSQELFDLIQSIQSKLGDEQDTNNNSETIDETQKETDNTNATSSSSNNNSGGGFDLGGLGSLLKNIDIGSVLNMFGGNNNSNSGNQNKTENNSGFDLGSIDPSTILKFQRILSSMNKTDPKKNLLLSLKPFLRKSRQDKLNEYITMLTIANALEIFGSKGSDEDV